MQGGEYLGECDHHCQAAGARPVQSGAGQPGLCGGGKSVSGHVVITIIPFPLQAARMFSEQGISGDRVMGFTYLDDSVPPDFQAVLDSLGRHSSSV